MVLSYTDLYIWYYHILESEYHYTMRVGLNNNSPMPNEFTKKGIGIDKEQTVKTPTLTLESTCMLGPTPTLTSTACLEAGY
jgi:hypothetical protein